MTICYDDWQAYPWKNELDVQSKRVTIHYAEMLSEEVERAHSPMHMLDRALVLAAFAIRRLCEKRLVTDELRAEKIAVRSFPADTSEDFRVPFKSRSGKDAFRSYHFDKPTTTLLTIGDLANEIIHSSQFYVCLQRCKRTRWTTYCLRLASEEKVAPSFYSRVYRRYAACAR
jgi:hypothetical protein